MRALPFFLFLTACFNPDLGEMPFRCGVNNECPPGYGCNSENFCVLGGGGGGHDVDGGTRPDGRNGGGGADGPARPDSPTMVGVADARSFPDAPAPTADAPVCVNPTQVMSCSNDHTALLCNGNQITCAFHCDANLLECQQCDPSRGTFCTSAGDAVGSCSSHGQVVATTPCPNFCQEDAQNAGRCVHLQPSNLDTKTCENSTTVDRTISADLNIDTDLCTGGSIVAQPSIFTVMNPPKICLLVFRDFGVSGSLTAHGANALAIVATRDLTVSGKIDVSAQGPTRGAGSKTDQPGIGFADTTHGYDSGGGAGAYAQTGAGGGSATTDGAISGGNIFGTQQVVPLVGGAYGGDGGTPATSTCVACPTIAKGGGGGGAVQLVGCHSATFTALAKVSAVGGGGQGGFGASTSGTPMLATAGGGGGGGAGGGILIEAGLLSMQSTTVLVATGGGGGGGGAFGVSTITDGKAGEDGQVLHGANGGAGGGDGAGLGGDGSLGEPTDFPDPTPGLAPNVIKFGAGGGGAGVGRIRVSSSPNHTFQTTGVTIVPFPTTDTVKFYP